MQLTKEQQAILCRHCGHRWGQHLLSSRPPPSGDCLALSLNEGQGLVACSCPGFEAVGVVPTSGEEMKIDIRQREDGAIEITMLCSEEALRSNGKERTSDDETLVLDVQDFLKLRKKMNDFWRP